MLSGTSTIVGAIHKRMLTDSIFSKRGAPKTTNAVTVAIQQANIPEIFQCS